MTSWQINQLGKAVLHGAVFAYPTDTIWGLGCHPLSTQGVGRILSIKHRPVEKGLILLASKFDFVEPYLSGQLNEVQKKQILQPTDRPTTWVVEANEYCPTWLRGSFPSIAIRLTDHPLVTALCEAIQSPLVSTSANRSGKTPIRNSIQARRQFGDEIDYVINGYLTGGHQASEIKFLNSGTSIRS